MLDRQSWKIEINFAAPASPSTSQVNSKRVSSIQKYFRNTMTRLSLEFAMATSACIITATVSQRLSLQRL